MTREQRRLRRERLYMLLSVAALALYVAVILRVPACAVWRETVHEATLPAVLKACAIFGAGWAAEALTKQRRM